MKVLRLLVLVPLPFIVSCDDDINPTADFEIIDFNGQTPILTFENLGILNKSQNGVKFSWDFGDGSKSTEKEPSFSYTKSGSYQVKLTVESKDRVKRTYFKEINVLDRILKRLTITSLNLTELDINGIDNNSKVDVFLTIKQYRTKEGVAVDNVLYQTNIVKLSPLDLPYEFNVLEKIVIDPSMINTDCLSFNIHVEIDGQTYVVGSNRYSGSSFGQWNFPEVPLSYVTSSAGGSFILNCDYD